MLNFISDRLVRLEMGLAAVMAAAVTLLILLNIVSRSLGMAIYWVDELAIYAMVWTTFLATSVALKRRQVIAVTLLVDLLGKRAQTWMQLLSDLIILTFSVALLVLCWRWLDPVTFAGVGFDIKEFQGETFNFLYSEKTNTIGIKKIWPWLILPLFSISLSLHALNNMLGSLKQAVFYKGRAE